MFSLLSLIFLLPGRGGGYFRQSSLQPSMESESEAKTLLYPYIGYKFCFSCINYTSSLHGSQFFFLLFLLLSLLSKLPINRSKDLCTTSLCSIDKLPFHLFRYQIPTLAHNIFFCFSNHQGAVFFFFLLLSIASSILQWHHEVGNFFSEYDQSNWLF